DAGVARAHRDLLGAVGMAVEAGLAHHESQPAPEPPRDAIDVRAQAVEALCRVAGGAADARGRAVFAVDLAQGRAPFAGGHARLRGFDRGRHDVAAFLGDPAQFLERRRPRFAVARATPRHEPRDLVRLDGLRYRDDGFFAGRERRQLALDVTVDADHG